MFTQLGIRNHMLPAHWGCSSWASRVRWVCGCVCVCWWGVEGVSVDCPLLSSPRLFILTLPPAPSSPRPSSRQQRPETAWLHVKANGAFCGSVANLPGKTQTICSERGLSGDDGVNTGVKPPRVVPPCRTHRTTESNRGALAQPQPPADKLQFKLQSWSLIKKKKQKTLLSRGSSVWIELKVKK